MCRSVYAAASWQRGSADQPLALAALSNMDCVTLPLLNSRRSFPLRTDGDLPHACFVTCGGLQISQGFLVLFTFLHGAVTIVLALESGCSTGR